jgi:hypothetical protein
MDLDVDLLNMVVLLIVCLISSHYSLKDEDSILIVPLILTQLLNILTYTPPNISRFRTGKFCVRLKKENACDRLVFPDETNAI